MTGWTIIVDAAKLRDYCLSRSHPRGRHKARLFESKLGLTAADATWLADALRLAAEDQIQNLYATVLDNYGQRYVLDFVLTTSIGSCVIRSLWIDTAPVSAGSASNVLRFVSCYIL